MTLAEITSLITSNIDTTGRRLTTGLKMREVLNGIVAYLFGIPDLAVTGLVYVVIDDVLFPKSFLDTPFTIESGGVVKIAVEVYISRGKNWGDIEVTGEGDDEFTVLYMQSTISSLQCFTGMSLSFDSYLEGEYTYTFNIGGLERSIIINVEGL
jgi:hypothetical protein